MATIPYFEWKGINSRAQGIVVNEYPPIMRAKERTTQVIVPGHPGSLTLTEGKDVHETVIKPCMCTIQPGADIQELINWLRGAGDVVFGNEPQFAYEARIDSQLSLDKLIRDWRTFALPFVCHPYKKNAIPEEDIILTGMGSVLNPGQIDSRPVLQVEGSGDVVFAINGRQTAIKGLSGAIRIDTAIGMAMNTDMTENMSESIEGVWPTLDVGANSIIWTGTITKITITPRWRWL